MPQHKAWQKELEATWDALCAGKYDWAHLAMHLRGLKAALQSLLDAPASRPRKASTRSQRA